MTAAGASSKPSLSIADLCKFAVARWLVQIPLPRAVHRRAYRIVLRTAYLGYRSGLWFRGGEPITWIPRIIALRDRCRKLALKAEQRGLADVANGFAILAANLSLDPYNILVLLNARDDDAERRYLGESLAIAATADGPPVEVDGIPWALEVGRLCADVFWAVSGMPWRDRELTSITNAFRGLAHLADTVVEPSTDWARDDGPLGRWAVTRRHELARLSAVYGDAKLALTRVADARDRIDIPERRFSLQLSLDVVAQYAARRAGEPQIAEQLRRERLELIEAARTTSRCAASRIRAMEELSPTVGHVLVAKFIGDVFDAVTLFDLAEAVRARTLLDFIVGEHRPLPAPEGDEALGLEASLIAYRIGTGAASAEDVPAWLRGILPDLTADTWRALRAQLVLASRTQADLMPAFLFGDRGSRDDDEVLSSLEALYARHDAGFTRSAMPVRLPDVQAALRDDEVLVEFAMPDNGYAAGTELYRIVITRDSVDCDRVIRDHMATLDYADGDAIVSWGPFAEQVARLRLAISREDDEEARRSLATHFAWLFDDCLDALPPRITRMIVVPTGGLHVLPFAALVDGAGRHLIERFAIVTVPSASVFQALCARRVASPRRCLAVGNPRPLANHRELPEAAAEVEAIIEELAAAGLATRSLTDTAATETVIRAELAAASIIHLATHGDFPLHDTHDRHAVLVAPDPGSDGRLEAHEIRQLGLRDTNLVVLSICDGALNRFGPGDELHGLVSAFLIAGATNVVGALWPSNDLMTRLFMTRFYRKVLADGPAVALATACRGFIKQSTKLKFWAGFTVVGTGRFDIAPAA
jgi:hypothetical protein